MTAKISRDAFANALIASRVAYRYLSAADYQEYVERKKREGEKPLDKKDWEARVESKGKGEGKGEGKDDWEKYQEATKSVGEVRKKQKALRDQYEKDRDQTDDPEKRKELQRKLKQEDKALEKSLEKDIDPEMLKRVRREEHSKHQKPSRMFTMPEWRWEELKKRQD